MANKTVTMSREFKAGLTDPVGDCGKFEASIDVDAWGARIAVYGDTSEDAEQLRAEVLAKLAAPVVEAATCAQCKASTTDICNQNGCGYLESGNGAPVVERQPTGFIYRTTGAPWEWMDESPYKDGRIRHLCAAEQLEPMYASPPAPVAVPEGWKLVPIEPTAGMIEALAREEWPADWEAGKRLQRLRGCDVVFPKSEIECAVGKYGRMIAVVPACLDKVKELNQ